MNWFKTWNKWEDVGIEYIQHEYEWIVVQTRTRIRDNKREVRHVRIMKWGGVLSDEVKSKMNEIINRNYINNARETNRNSVSFVYENQLRPRKRQV